MAAAVVLEDFLCGIDEGGTSETLRDLIGKRIMNAAETGEELLAYDMIQGFDLAA